MTLKAILCLALGASTASAADKICIVAQEWRDGLGEGLRVGRDVPGEASPPVWKPTGESDGCDNSISTQAAS